MQNKIKAPPRKSVSWRYAKWTPFTARSNNNYNKSKKPKKKQHEESQIWKKDLQAKRTHVETELQENKAQLHALETKQATLKKEWKA